MKIAVLGAGFSGLATAWHLLQKGCQVTLFDAAGIGGGASGIAAGLLHTYAGAHAKLNWLGLEGWNATCELLEISSKEVGRPIADFSGMLRLSITDQQKTDFQISASKYPDIDWWSHQKCVESLPNMKPYEGIWIKKAATVDCKLYMQGLWAACEKLGALFEKVKIESLHELVDFDAIVVAMGVKSGNFPELSHLPLTPIKGQVLELSWPEEIPQLPFAVNSQAYLAADRNRGTCIAGATYEREFTHSEPDVAVAQAEIMSKVMDIMPALNRARILDCRSGIRASTPDHRPIAKQVSGKCWVITGMGSRGLLYHALFAAKITEKIVTKS